MEKEFSYKKGKIEQPVLKRNKLPYTPLMFAINFYGMLLRNDARRVYNYQNRSAPDVVFNRRVQLEKEDPYERPYVKALLEGWVDIRYRQSKASQEFDITNGTGKRILEFRFIPSILKDRRMELTLRTIAKQYQEWFNEQYKPKEEKIDPKLSKYMFLLNPVDSLLPVLDEKVKQIPNHIKNLLTKYSFNNNLDNKFTNPLNKSLNKDFNQIKNIDKSIKVPKLWFDIYAVKGIKPNGKLVFERRRVQGYNSFVNALNAIKTKPVEKLYQALPQITEGSVINSSVFNLDSLAIDTIKEQPNKIRFIVRQSTLPVAQVILKNKTLYSLWVEPEYRNKGVATWLLKKVLSGSDVEKIEPAPFKYSPFNGKLCTNEVSKEDLISFYKKLGFKKVENDNFMYLNKQDLDIEEAYDPAMAIPSPNKQSMVMPTYVPIQTMSKNKKQEIIDE